MHSHSHAIAWIKDAKEYLASLSDPILASSQDCDYFRQKFKQSPKKEEPAPTPPSIPRPVSKPPEPIQPPPTAPVLEPAPPSAKTHAPVPVEILPPSPPEPKQPLKKPVSYTGLRSILAKVAPELAIFSDIPTDLIAKKIAIRWKTKNQTAPITLIFYQENPAQKALLEQIAKALDVYFGPAKLIAAETVEKEKEWEALLSVPELKLIISCDYTLWQLPNLMRFYKETPAQKTRQLGDKPLFMLPDLSLYLKDPLLKRSLWKALCQTISSFLSPSTKN